MQAAEEAAFAGGITADALMEEAGAAIARFVDDLFPAGGTCRLFVGKGHNGGDALVAGRHLRQRGWRVEETLVFAESDCAALTRLKLRELRSVRPSAAPAGAALVFLDGILGLGATSPLRGPVAIACREINRLRLAQNAFVIAIDLPTGLHGDTGELDAEAVTAAVTIAIGYVKRGLVADGALDHVGRLAVALLPELPPPAQPSLHETMAIGPALRPLLKPRKFGAYKNQSGSVGIVAGSRGLTGAAVLCGLGALRGGAGLVHLFVPEQIYPAVAAAAPSEAMVRPVSSWSGLLETDLKITAWAVGPGLGAEGAEDICRLIEEARPPMVVDADGLNALARDIGVLDRSHGPRLLTPHPGEMKRLTGETNGTRRDQAREFVALHAGTLLLKGSRTLVAERGRALSYNTTGHPGMASGGMGDVLTGVCAALIAQGLVPYDAARLGAWLCGRAAELAIFHGGQSEHSLLAHDVAENLGAAFRDLQG